MKLIINTVNLKIGGAFQRSISFVKELKLMGNENENEYFIFYNDSFKEQIPIDSFPQNFYFYYFAHSPASLITRHKIISQFNLLEKKINPDIVFSFVGPCYWRAKSPQLVGFGMPHIVYNEYEYVKNLSLKSKLEMIYKKYWTKKEADYYVVQTKDVQERLASILNINQSKVFLVSNGIGNQYKNAKLLKKGDLKVKKLLMISTYRPSKNFEIIKEVIPYLEKDLNFKYEFHLTIKDEDFQRVFQYVKRAVVNHGHVYAKDCPDLYNNCDAMFLPSHLECFSASYPEAMKMEKPILTSDLSFAKTVCHDAAIYFDNTKPVEIAEKIMKLFADNDLYNSLVQKGKNRLVDFDNSSEQAKKYLNICNDILKQQR